MVAIEDIVMRCISSDKNLIFTREKLILPIRSNHFDDGISIDFFLNWGQVVRWNFFKSHLGMFADLGQKLTAYRSYDLGHFTSGYSPVPIAHIAGAWLLA